MRMREEARGDTSAMAGGVYASLGDATVTAAGAERVAFFLKSPRSCTAPAEPARASRRGVPVGDECVGEEACDARSLEPMREIVEPCEGPPASTADTFDELCDRRAP